MALAEAFFYKYTSVPGIRPSTGLSNNIADKTHQGHTLLDSFRITLEEKLGRPLSKAEMIRQLFGSTAYALLAITHAEAKHLPNEFSRFVQNATERAANSKILGRIAVDDWSNPHGT